MDLSTGLKQARLNVPEQDDAPKADIVIVDNTPVRLNADEEAEAEPITPQGIKDQSKPDRDYDYLRPSLDPEESSLFASETSNLRSSSLPTLENLSALTDLVHSYDWGLALAQVDSLIHKLISTFQPYSRLEAPIEIRSAIALLLGTAIQNNPEALAALLSHTDSGSESDQDLIYAVVSTLSSPLEQTSPIPEVQLRQRSLFLLHQLASSPAELCTFINFGGLDLLYSLFTFSNTNKGDMAGPVGLPRIIPGDDGRDKLRQRVANLMLDHVLPLLERSDPWTYVARTVSMNENEDTHQDEGEEVSREELEQWNEAFEAALREYAVFMSERDESEAPVVYKTYSSISEASLLLKKVLGVE